jgi:hypothetical protein
MTQNTETPAHAAVDEIGAYALTAGEYDSERIVEIVIGTFEQVQTHADGMNRTLRQVLGERGATDHQVVVGGPYIITDLAEPTEGVTTLRIDAEQLAAQIDQLGQSLDQIAQGYSLRDLTPVSAGLTNAQRELSELHTLLIRGRRA